MSLSCPRMWNGLRGNKLLLLLVLILLIAIVTVITQSGVARPGVGHSTTSQSAERGPPSSGGKENGGNDVLDNSQKGKKNQRQKGKEEKTENAGDDTVLSELPMETDNGAGDNDGNARESTGGFFGFVESVANTDWLKPFRPSTFRDPEPAPWDSGFSEDLSAGDVEADVDQNVQNEIEPDTQGETIEEDSGRSSDESNENEDESDDNVSSEQTQTKKPRVRDEKRKAPSKGSRKPSVKSNPAFKFNRIPEKDLFDIFYDKLSKITGKSKKLGDTCFNRRTVSNSCDGGKCRQMKLPAEPEERVKQLIQHPGLRLSAPQHAVLEEMASKVRNSYDVILLTTASSNHFLESQALLQNLHQNVFPVLKNFTLLFYDIGLTAEERSQMEKYCQCQVLSFPFDKLPRYVQNLKCYAWKPLMVKAHVRQANVLLWLDASIRFNGDPSQLQALIQRVKDRGVQIGSSNADTTFRSFRSLYHYFGDEPCMYLGMGQAKATIGGYHNEPFVERAILEPWAACALHQECMCPKNNLSAGCAESKKVAEEYLHNNGPIIYGLCHRFDQSTITLILHKLYQQNYPWVMMNVHEYGDILRDHQVEYFKGLK
ncbi:hypothetical protein ElyMa_003564900 [Elysia marginata]|uniref:Uncharacterized protein n=1 Tax=Elysia marginata TaxID=1093978 RepID=A0AAV4EMA4_9GAST|nr:hypothetical protein ElyMa_003564900 [Elysia marginata]